jgi:hypothetical protein
LSHSFFLHAGHDGRATFACRIGQRNVLARRGIGEQTAYLYEMIIRVSVLAFDFDFSGNWSRGRRE